MAAAEKAFAHRGDPAELERAIALWGEAAELGDDPGLRLRLCRAQSFAALTAPPQERRERLVKGADEARRALLLLHVAEAEACTTASKESAPAIFWLAENLDAHARELGIVAGATERRQVLCLARRAAELDPSYFFAAPLRLLGRVLAQSPALSGGDAEASRKAFVRAQELAPQCLWNRTDLAATWAVKVQDKQAFAEAIEAVLSADPGPEVLRPENQIARARAQRLKAEQRFLFK
jgi:hypothetical protein